ncbi:MAG: hypothetical protein ABR608_11255 [Pseudonocardiaceae bacterium]
MTITGAGGDVLGRLHGGSFVGWTQECHGECGCDVRVFGDVVSSVLGSITEIVDVSVFATSSTFAVQS